MFNRIMLVLVICLLSSVGLRAADKWVFIGDSLTVGMIGNGRDYRSRVKSAFNVDITVVNTSRVGKHVTEYVREIDAILRNNRDAKYFPILIGANDVRAYSDRKAQWLRSKLVTVLDKIVAAGKVPILMRLTYNRRQEGDPRGSFNTSVYDPLIRQYSPRWFNNASNKGLIDVHGWVRSHQQYLARDGVHLTGAGYRAARQELLVDVMASVVYGNGTVQPTENVSGNEANISLVGQSSERVEVANSQPAVENKSKEAAELELCFQLSGVLQNDLDRQMCLCRAGELIDQLLQQGASEATVAESVKQLQAGLQREGFPPGPVDGRYGPRTKKAVRKMTVTLAQRYLQTMNINPGPIDGIEGPLTRGALARFWANCRTERPFEQVTIAEVAILRMYPSASPCD